MVSIGEAQLQKQSSLTLKNYRVCLKVKIEDGISHRKIQACEGDNRFIDHHSHGSRQRHLKSLLQISVLEIQGSNYAIVPGLYAKHFGSALQNHRCVGFGYEH